MKKIIIILTLSLFVFISGCSTGGGDNEIEIVEVHKGSQGLEFDFIKNMPPDSVYSNQDFLLGVKVLNKGAYDIKRGIIQVTGDPGYITFRYGGISDYNDIRNLEGRKTYDPREKEEVYNFEAEVMFADEGFEEHESLLIFSACYDYMNSLVTQLCVDPDVYNQKPGEKNCVVKDLSFSGQGGPVGISSVEPQMLKRNDAIYPQFKFIITNFGQGEVFSPGKSDAFCSSSDLDKDSINFIKLTKIEFSDILLSDLDCFPSKDKIVLRDNKAEIVCSLKDGSPKRLSSDTDAYTSSLIIEFEYGYSISKSKKIMVVNQET